MIGPLMTPRDQGGLQLEAPHPDGGSAISHSGGTGGFRSFVKCIPEWKRGVAVLSNACIDAVVDLGVHVLDPRCGLIWYREESAIDPACFARLVGRYRLRPNWVFEVTSITGRLYIRLPTSGRCGRFRFRNGIFSTKAWVRRSRSNRVRTAGPPA